MCTRVGVLRWTYTAVDECKVLCADRVDFELLDGYLQEARFLDMLCAASKLCRDCRAQYSVQNVVNLRKAVRSSVKAAVSKVRKLAVAIEVSMQLRSLYRLRLSFRPPFCVNWYVCLQCDGHFLRVQTQARTEP